MRVSRLAFLLAILAAAPQAAAEECVPGAERATISEVVNAATLRFANGGAIRLAGIFVPSEAGDGAHAVLSAMAAGKEVALGNRSAKPDRYARVSAHVFAEGGRWLQGELLQRGLAMVLTLRDDRACAGALLAAEQVGRKAGAGIWANPDFAIGRAEDPSLLGRRNLYQIVEGRVLSVGKTQTTVYLDFGRNWGTDFTVTVSVPDAALFESEGLPPRDLEGRRVRVRGWLVEANGPMIRVDHPEQIEVLDR